MVPVGKGKQVESVDKVVSELIALLNQEIELHKELLSLVQRDRGLLIDLSVEEIFENNKRKETCTLKIKMLEESRALLVEQLSQHFAIPPQELTLSKIISLIDEPHCSLLASTFSTLSALLKSIQEINQGSALIIKDSLYYFTRALDFLHCASLVSPTYVDSGKIKDPMRYGRLISREI
jgi:flagellar biosynthesis/type III secretory pathway chaperone